jgi:hypothetical protein
MATSDILGLFTTPEQYQLAQRQAQDAEALQYAKLDPMAQAQYGFYRAGQQIGGAIGGALGGEDPQLKLISQRQQILGMIDPTNPDSYAQGIQMALQTGDTQTAYVLRNEMMKSTQQAQELKRQAQEDQLKGLQITDVLTQRGMTMQTQGLTNMANELVSQLINPDKTINEEVKAKLLSFPQGRAAISEQAKVLPALRQLGALSGAIDNPFVEFTQDTTTPKNVLVLAKQFEKELQSGVLDPEKVSDKLKMLSSMSQSIKQFEQNQEQIKAQQQILNGFRQQGLDNSEQSLALRESLANLQMQNMRITTQLRVDEANRKKDDAKTKPLPASLQRDESKDLELVDSLSARADALVPAIQSLTIDPKTKKPPLELGLINNAKYMAQNASSNSTPESRAYAALQRAVQEATNLKTDAAKGVQTDKDVLRFANELTAAFGGNDTKTSLEALNNFYKSTKNAEEKTKRRIDSRRLSQKVEPYYGATSGTAKNPIKLD